MHVIHISAELAPIAKVGGLADVIHGLSRALINKGHDVTVILPKYATLDLRWIEHFEIFGNQSISFERGTYHNTLWRGIVDHIPVIFIESHDPHEFFERSSVYGCSDDIARFTYFSLSAFHYLQNHACDVVHLHDWHTALLAGLIKEKFPDNLSFGLSSSYLEEFAPQILGFHDEVNGQGPFTSHESTRDASKLPKYEGEKPRTQVNKAPKVILTIHNLAYQGWCNEKDFEKIGWKSPHFRQKDHYNLLQGGIIFSDHITTVSPTYAQEILTAEMGRDLDTILKENSEKMTGILNGIDYDFWNPEKDPYLPSHYSVNSLEQKEKIKQALRKRLSLEDEASPLVCAVTRLVPQKGPELIKAAILRTLEWGGQFVLLGSALDEKTHAHFYNLKRKLYGSQHVHLELSFSEELSHLVFAASDIFLIPSLFEPCGLTQQIAMHYGTIPIARATGGLVDTVIEKENGFLFEAATAESLHTALDQALETWYEHPEIWKRLINNGMSTDFSWNKPTDQYIELYYSS